MSVIDHFDGANRFLSNFYPYPFWFGGRKWATSEHAFQAAKTYDPEWVERIASAPSPGAAKRLGRSCPMYAGWDSFRVRAMEDILFAKFSDRAIRNLLLETGSAQLIEGNDWGDRFWGVCDGVGENTLGRLLMGVRDYYARLDDSEKVIEEGIGLPPLGLDDLIDTPFMWKIQNHKDGVQGTWWATVLVDGKGGVREQISDKGRTAYESAAFVLAEVFRRKGN